MVYNKPAGVNLADSRRYHSKTPPLVKHQPLLLRALRLRRKSPAVGLHPNYLPPLPCVFTDTPAPAAVPLRAVDADSVVPPVKYALHSAETPVLLCRESNGLQLALCFDATQFHVDQSCIKEDGPVKRNRAWSYCQANDKGQRRTCKARNLQREVTHPETTPTKKERPPGKTINKSIRCIDR